ncbi:LacI family DNA-binding transcriptional regulator [Candidatus Bipolaricaulota bacterium]|nr:LacI family DNA-binding transcriptional regulator [Candidatus Bipolaricaulota bacterium]
MATMKDVAKLADVSVTTVSHVINGTRYVSPELTGRVNRAIEELDYHPDPLAQGLSKGESQTIALVVSDIVNPFFPQVARGVEDCVREHEFSLILSNTDENANQESQNISLLESKRVDGFVISPTGGGGENIQPLIEKDLPVVCIDRELPEVTVDQVFSDNREGGYKAIQHLIDRGHENIGIILESTEIASFKHRLEGYKDALKDHGIEIEEEYIKKSGLEVEGAYASTESLLSDHPEVTAIFSTNDLMTEGVLRYFKEHEVKCPEDIALVGFDDPEWAASFNPSITSIAQQPYEMGYQAAHLLFEEIEGTEKARTPRKIELDTELRIRESSASAG